MARKDSDVSRFEWAIFALAVLAVTGAALLPFLLMAG